MPRTHEHDLCALGLFRNVARTQRKLSPRSLLPLPRSWPQYRDAARILALHFYLTLASAFLGGSNPVRRKLISDLARDAFRRAFGNCCCTR